MMKRIRVLTAFLLMLPIAASAGEFKTEPAIVDLVGRFERPHFTEEETGKQGRFYAIHLDNPIDVAPDEFGDQVKGIELLQLVFLGSSEETQRLVEKLDNQRIKVSGTLFHSNTAHHKTRVLITVKEIKEIGAANQAL